MLYILISLVSVILLVSCFKEREGTSLHQGPLQKIYGNTISIKFLERIIPSSHLGSAIAAALLVSPLAVIGVLLGTKIYGVYGFAMFVTGPFVLGLLSALIHGFHAPKSKKSCFGVATIAVMLLTGLLLILAIEGMICILMALPLGWLLALLGSLVGHFIQRRPAKQLIAGTLPLLILLIPLSMGMEYQTARVPKLRAVSTSVIIQASSSTVWKNVIAFPRLPEPKELLFRAGIAYPTHAQIEGVGVGAVRQCHFSTGYFLEPITAWDDERRLSFDVTSQPLPMKELSPYGHLDTPHLHEILLSQKGQFLLTHLDDGKVQLEGTTWYTNNMWPQWYWNLWSDHIIHRIHLRVLNHIKSISQNEV